ncbi:peroxisomal membrane protein PMP34 isoform X3 [Megachile rotundata]|uniref:peroxisomal membrane protein PMP34 isoform X3 n=1 Tax=Megachile rotundata TaxID=143995 RepID=UPI003FD3D967
MLGSARVGKTAIVARFLSNKFEESYTPTIEDFHRKLYRIRGEVHQLDLLDTSGNHPFPAMRRLSFLTGDLFVVVFSLDCRESFEEAIRLRESILETKVSATQSATKSRSKSHFNLKVPMVIVGNKCDKDVKTVTVEEAEEYCNSQDDCCVFVEASAKRNYHVEELFYQLFVVAGLPLEMAPNHHRKVPLTFGSPTMLPPSQGSVVAMATFFPLDTVRSRLQLEEDHRSKSTLATIRELVEKEGICTLYRGMVPVLQSLCASNFVYFYTFHGLKMLKARRNQTASNDLLFASIAGVINVLSTTPLWVVNTRLKMRGVEQAHERNNNEYNTLFDGLTHIWKYEGPGKLWSGTLPSLMLVTNPAIQFMTYETIKRKVTTSLRNSQPPAWMFFAIGAAAKAIATAITYPLQLVQTKLRHGHKYPNLPPDAGTLEILFYILKKQGIGALYKGMEAKLLQTILTAALMFLTYEKISRFVFRILLRRPVLR